MPARLSIDAQKILNYSEDTTPNYSETIMFQHYLANKWGLGALYTISHDGTSENSFSIYPHHLLQQHLTALESGLSSAYDKGFWVKTAWTSFNDPGGFFPEGKTIRELWVDMPAAEGGSVWFLAGSDPFGTGAFKITLPAAVVGEGEVRPSWCQAINIEGLTGRGLAVIYNAPYLLTGGSFRGFGGKVQ